MVHDHISHASEYFNLSQGIRAALGVSVVVLALVFAAGWRWFPRGAGALMTDAQREENRLAASEQ